MDGPVDITSMERQPNASKSIAKSHDNPSHGRNNPSPGANSLAILTTTTTAMTTTATATTRKTTSAYPLFLSPSLSLPRYLRIPFSDCYFAFNIYDMVNTYTYMCIHSQTQLKSLRNLRQ